MATGEGAVRQVTSQRQRDAMARTSAPRAGGAHAQTPRRPAGLAAKRLPQSLQASPRGHQAAARLKRLLRERVPHNPQEPRVLLSATGAPTRVTTPLLTLLDALKKLRVAQCPTRGG